jgi:hypothetical protein
MGIEPPPNFGAEAGGSDQNRHRQRGNDHVGAGLVAPKALEQTIPVRPGNNRRTRKNARKTIESRKALPASAHGSTCIVLGELQFRGGDLAIYLAGRRKSALPRNL